MFRFDHSASPNTQEALAAFEFLTKLNDRDET